MMDKEYIYCSKVFFISSPPAQLLKSSELSRHSLLYLKEIGHGWFGKVQPFYWYFSLRCFSDSERCQCDKYQLL